ncbi:MAG: hypothetical protein RSC64_05355 [Hydrogenoanaerobacterium sp.]
MVDTPGLYSRRIKPVTVRFYGACSASLFFGITRFTALSRLRLVATKKLPCGS